MSYIGMTSRLFVTRAQDHLQYIQQLIKLLLHNILICTHLVVAVTLALVRQCNIGYEAKIQETLLIKKVKPKLSTQLYANDSSFLPNVF